jgi:hypothetical protein
MISNVLDYNFDPYTAATLQRMLPMRDDFIIEIEARIPEQVVCGLAKRGGKLSPLAPYTNMGSYQQAWREPQTGLLRARTDPRFAGNAAASETSRAQAGASPLGSRQMVGYSEIRRGLPIVDGF